MDAVIDLNAKPVRVGQANPFAAHQGVAIFDSRPLAFGQGLQFGQAVHFIASGDKRVRIGLLGGINIGVCARAAIENRLAGFVHRDHSKIFQIARLRFQVAQLKADKNNIRNFCNRLGHVCVSSSISFQTSSNTALAEMDTGQPA